MKRSEIFKYISNSDNIADLRITEGKSSKTSLAKRHLKKQNNSDPKDADLEKYFEEKYTK